MRDLGDVARMAARLPEELSKAQRRGVQKGALTVTRAMRDEVRAVTGGDSRLSGVGRRGAKIGARYDIKGQREPTAIIRATGPAQLVEHDTKPHEIRPRRRRGGKAKALRFADGAFARSARHPGTRARKPYERGYLKTKNQTGQIFDKEVQSAIARAMR
jgi:hypothetical protein